MPDPIATRRAQAELDDIFDYVADDAPDAARRTSRRFDDAFRLLARNPSLGRDRSRLLPGTRSFTLGSYVIFYSPTEESVEILRVIHGARDIRTLLRGDEESS